MKNGSYKKFLKPNLLKILLTMVFLVLSYFFLPIPTEITGVYPGAVSTWNFLSLRYSQFFSEILYNLGIGNGMLIGASINFLGIGGGLGEIIALIILLVLSYVLSCFVVSLYKRKK